MTEVGPDIAALSVYLVTAYALGLGTVEEKSFAFLCGAAKQILAIFGEGIVLGLRGPVSDEFFFDGRSGAFGGSFKQIEMEFLWQLTGLQAVEPLCEYLISGGAGE